MQSALRDDALITRGDGIAVRVGLPWIRSLPLACVRDLSVSVDGAPVDVLRLELDDRRIGPDELVNETGWWFIQDRLLVVADISLAPGDHRVEVELVAMIPYLLAGPGGTALTLPLRMSRELTLDHPAVPSVSLDVA